MRLVRSVELSGALRAWGGMRDQSRNLDHCLRYFHSAIHAAVDRNLVRLVFLGLGMLEGVGWRMTWNSTFKTPGQPLKRSAWKPSNPLISKQSAKSRFDITRRTREKRGPGLAQ